MLDGAGSRTGSERRDMQNRGWLSVIYASAPARWVSPPSYSLPPAAIGIVGTTRMILKRRGGMWKGRDWLRLTDNHVSLKTARALGANDTISVYSQLPAYVCRLAGISKTGSVAVLFPRFVLRDCRRATAGEYDILTVDQTRVINVHKVQAMSNLRRQACPRCDGPLPKHSVDFSCDQ
ncbi:hypothetical protein DAEQUDRAFT_331517 [Daedalea quercina L-15889]|uniref:Uncharacterized protein n=1 Tax=Daedalea quercina L-15889 TaxID=1314783 RepID=A0A165PLD6_9APHY|nr:hypothetical protein DAEQUDRAFT_331517 [Daedalea quercina L-15889]